MEKGNNCSNFLRDSLIIPNTHISEQNQKGAMSEFYGSQNSDKTQCTLYSIYFYFIQNVNYINCIIAWKYVRREFCNLKEQSMNFLWSHRALKLEGILGQSVQCSYLTDEKTETRKTEWPYSLAELGLQNHFSMEWVFCSIQPYVVHTDTCI